MHKLLIPLLLTGLFAGCLDDDQADDLIGPAGPEASDVSFESYTETFDIMVLVGVEPLGPLDPARASWTFDVADGATELIGGGDWSCVSLCLLEVTLADPAGDIVFQENIWGWDRTFDAPAPGTWTLSIATGEPLTVGTQGELTVTVA